MNGSAQPEQGPGTDKGGKPRRRRITALRVAGALLLLLVVTVVAIVVAGPLRVSWLAQTIAERASLGPASISIVDAYVDVDANAGLMVVLRDAHLKIDGEVPVEVVLPQIEVPIDGKALISGKLNFASLTLDRAKIFLGVPDGGNPEIPAMSGLMEAVDKIAKIVDGEFAQRTLQKVNINNAEVEVTGALKRRVSGIDATITRSNQGQLTGYAKVAGRFGPWSMRLDWFNPQDGGESFGIKFQNITLGDLLDPSKEVAFGKGLGLPMAAELLAKFDKDGNFLGAGALGRVKDGWFRLGRTDVRFDDAAVELAWNAQSDDILIKKSHVIYRNTKIFYEGRVTPPKTAGEDWDIQLISDYPQFGSSDIPMDPMVLESISINGRFDQDAKTLFFDKAELKAGRAKAYASGSLQLAKDGPYLAISMAAEHFPVGMAKQVWPITLVPPGRRWIIDRVKTGVLNHMSLTAAVRPPAFNPNDPDAGWSGDDMVMDIDFSDGEITPVGDVPPISGLHGTVSIADEVLTVNAEGGSIAGNGGPDIAVTNATFKILNLPLREGKMGDLDVSLNGPVRRIAEILDKDPFNVLKRAKLTSDGVTGTANVEMTASFPLVKDLNFDEVNWTAEAQSQNFTSPHEINGHKIANADVTLKADQSQLSIKGDGLLDGLKANIDLLIPLGDSQVKARQGVTLTVTSNQLKDLGVDLTNLITGTFEMTVADGDNGRKFDVNLTPAEIHLDALGWQKAKGVPASAEFTLTEGDGGQEIRGFKLDSDGVDVAGTLDITKGGELRDASLSRFNLRTGDDASLSVKRGSSGQYAVVIKGKAFDARGLIRSFLKSKKQANLGSLGSSMQITVNLDQVIGFKGTRIESFAGVIQQDRKGLKAVDVTGLLDGRAPFTFMINEPGKSGARKAEGDFADSGVLLKFLDLYGRMRGGTGKLNVTMNDETNWVGSFRVTGLSITEDPAIRQLGQRQADNLNDERVSATDIGAAGTGEASFQKLDIEFTRAGDVVDITKGALQGTVIGGTVSGAVDLSKQTLNLNGTFVPIYALNNIFSKIPLLGFALGGDSQEGLIGVTYRINGPISDPVLTVNPMSVIAPGIFRKMFEFQ